MFKSHAIVGYIFSFIVVLCFSIYPAIAPIGLQSGASPFGFVFFAMLESALSITGLVLLRKDKLLPSKDEIGALLLISLIFLFEHVLLLYALRYLQVPVAMSLIYTYPFIIALIGICNGSVKANLQLFSFLIICLIGVILVVGFAREQLHFIGIILALAQAMMAAFRILLTAHLLKKSAGLVLTARMLIIAVFLSLPLMFIFDLTLPKGSAGWFAVLIAGISGMIGHGCLAQALKRIETITFAILMNLEPIFAALLSAVILGQVLNIQQYFGAILVVVSVSFYSYVKINRNVSDQ